MCFRASLLCGALVLTFDQVAFFAGLHMLTGAGLAVLVGGWIAKMGAVLLYSVLAAVYLVYLERPLGSRRSAPRIADVFDTLTYRERYEDLLARTGSDALTGTLDRHSLESHGRRAVEHGRQRRPSAGAAGDRPRPFQGVQRPLRPCRRRRDAQVASPNEIIAAARASDFIYRFGGEEFIVIADGVAGDDALALGERIRRRIAGIAGDGPGVAG